MNSIDGLRTTVLCSSSPSNVLHSNRIEVGIVPNHYSGDGTAPTETDPNKNWRRPSTNTSGTPHQIAKVFPDAVRPVFYDALEVPDRLLKIISRLQEMGIAVTETEKQVPLEVLQLAHTPDYLDALNILSSMTPDGGNSFTLGPDMLDDDEIKTLNDLWNVWRTQRGDQAWTLERIAAACQQAGLALDNSTILKYLQIIYSTDSFAPISYWTYPEAVRSATLMYQLANKALAGELDFGLALCRPSNHHAGPDYMGGYCYLNNSAIAAKYLASQGKKVAILDVDYHHGNGTQDICWNDPNILTVSIHGDNKKYPFSGGEDETGPITGPAANTNLNLVVGDGATFEGEYGTAYQKALNRVKEFNPDVILFGFGGDTHRDEPYPNERFGLTFDDYRVMGRQVMSLAQELQAPLLMELLGGYNVATLPESIACVVSGILEART